MIRVWLVLHLLGFTLWIGGGVAAMVTGIAAKHEGRESLGAVARGMSLLNRLVIGPGALVTVLSGLILTFAATTEYASADPWLMTMQGAGIVAGLVTLFISVPTAARLGRIEPTGQTAGYFDELRRRQRLAGAFWGILALVALVAGAMTS